MKIRTSIIGLGKIGMRYDSYHKYNIGNYLSEVKNNRKLELVSVLDILDLKSKNLKKLLNNIEFFQSINLMLKETNPELVIICSNTKSHKNILLKTLKYNPKYIIIEKPVCNNYSQLKNLLSIKNTSKIYVNYIKRYSKIYEDLIKILKKKPYGTLKSINISYYGENFNIGSHFIDIINFIINENLYSVKNIKTIKTKQFNIKYFLINGKYQIEIKRYKINNLYSSEIEILLEKGKIKILDNETKLVEYSLNKSFKGFKKSSNYFNEFFQKKSKIYSVPKKTHLSKFLGLILKKKKTNLADLNDALKVHKLFEKIHK